MNAAEVLDVFEQHDAVRRGHFRLSSGLHSDTYLQCALVLQWPGLAERLGHELGERLRELAPTAVVGPAMGGIIIAHETARYLGARMLFTERVDGHMQFRRNLSLDPGDRVVIVEDVVTTGRSPREVMELVAGYGAETVGVGAIVDRSEELTLGVRLSALLRLDAGHWPEGQCPLCSEGEPLAVPGSRHLSA